MKEILFTLALAGACMAQEWQIGGGAGAAIYTNATVTRGGEEADAGFKPGPAFSAFGIQNLYEHLGGELFYTFSFGDMKVSRGGAEATFAGQSHAFGYNLLFFTSRRDAAVRPYFLAGGGGKVYLGTGEERAEAPPNAQFAILTHTTQIVGLADFGAGVSVRVGKNWRLRFDVRDYLTPVPKEVIAPAPGAKISDWIHAITPTVSFSYAF